LRVLHRRWAAYTHHRRLFQPGLAGRSFRNHISWPGYFVAVDVATPSRSLYWLIRPEDRVLIAHELAQDGYRVVKTIHGEKYARIPPFQEAELDLAYILGD